MIATPGMEPAAKLWIIFVFHIEICQYISPKNCATAKYLLLNLSITPYFIIEVVTLALMNLVWIHMLIEACDIVSEGVVVQIFAELAKN